MTPNTSSTITQSSLLTCLILPGNGCSDIRRANWYSWLSQEVKKQYPTAHVICESLPDPDYAREKYWIPWVKNKIGQKWREVQVSSASTSVSLTIDADLPHANEKLIIIGHSSGAVCLMRLLETYKIDSVILVSGCISDLGEVSERISCYYPEQPMSDSDDFITSDKISPIKRPWRWDLMKKHALKNLIHIGSSDDPFIPVTHMRTIRDELGLVAGKSYFEFEDQGHFMVGETQEIWKIVRNSIGEIMK